MTTSHELAAMTSEQIELHLLDQAIQTQIRDMRDDAAHMDQAGEAAAARWLRLHADRLEQAMNPTGVIQR